MNVGEGEDYSEDDEEDQMTGPLTGVPHLRKLGLIPSTVGRDHSQDAEENIMEPTDRKHKVAGKYSNPLHTMLSFDYGDNDVIGQYVIEGKHSCVNCNSKQRLKLGKYAKSSVGIVRQENWPHNAVSRKYVKRTSYDNMDFETFVTGEVKIIYGMWCKNNDDALGRLKLLMLMAHWMCKSRDWPLLRGLFESIIEEIETGDCKWTDDFSSYEAMIPTGNVSNYNISVVNVEHKKKAEIYWCKAYQNNSCKLTSSHISVIKADEPPVPVLHICATCWGQFKKRPEHAEVDSACPAKKVINEHAQLLQTGKGEGYINVENQTNKTQTVQTNDNPRMCGDTGGKMNGHRHVGGKDSMAEPVGNVVCDGKNTEEKKRSQSTYGEIVNVNCHQHRSSSSFIYMYAAAEENDYHSELWHNLNITEYVIATGKYNVVQARIPLKSNWNMRLFWSLCESDSDREVATFLQFGWPLNRQEGPVTQTYGNHKTTLKYPQQVWKYLMKEMAMGTLLGPFVTTPFNQE